MIIHQVNNYYGNRNQEYLRVLYRSLISTAYFGLFRVGELTSGDHLVLAKDVHLGSNKRKVLFILRTSKTHWKNERPQSIKISSKKLTAKNRKSMPKAKGGYETPCPYSVLKQYLEIRGPFSNMSKPFFIFADKSPVAPHHL